MTNPKEFCEAMHELVARSQRNPATAVSDQAYQMKLRILDFFWSETPSRTSSSRCSWRAYRIPTRRRR